MREQLGLEQPERSIGLAAHDFSMLAAGGEVLLTRALKADGAPTIASRWLQRMLQLCGGLKWENAPIQKKDPTLKDKLAPEDGSHLIRVNQLSEVQSGPRISRPSPKSRRWQQGLRHLSVTEIETWLRDPYAIYAKHVLGLRPLDPLDPGGGTAGTGQRPAQGAGDCSSAKHPAITAQTTRWRN